eukprot:5949045-Prymnesium_polylepis.2
MRPATRANEPKTQRADCEADPAFAPLRSLVRTNGVKQDRDDSETLGGVMLIRVAPNGYIGLEPPARREPLTAERLERFGCDDW